MSALLDRLVEEAVEEVRARRRRTSLSDLERRAGEAPPPRDLAAGLKGPKLAVIAEMKASTPLQGQLTTHYDPHRLAGEYTRGGAAALSVLCQETSFGGSPEHLALARAASELPIMRKDFIVDEYQLVEARALGADACLLIVAALTPKRLRSLLDCTRQLRMEALVETHTADEVKTALDVGARVVGVNHRNLDTFKVDMSLTQRFRELVPNECVLIAESGIKDAADARRMRAAGADAVLVGEALMRSPSPAKLIHEFAS